MLFVLVIVPLIIFASCASMLYGPIGQKINQDMPKDLSDSDYCDYKVEKCKLPDGKVADVYLFENIHDQVVWLNTQKFALQEDGVAKGIYDMAYTGDFRAKNPTDYYKTSFIKNYLASNDGKASKGTTLFEGICFDYADFAYQELRDNKSSYSSRIAKFYMVGTFKDANDIIAYRIAKNGENSDMTINQTPVVVFSHNHIHAHDGATSHAWFWVQATDGTMYWVDPTWTDNSGRPVYGIVRGGQEIQLPYEQSLCVK